MIVVGVDVTIRYTNCRSQRIFAAHSRTIS
jgi:hypothetical protein